MKNLSLSVPVPCHEDWDKMLPEEKGRFCNSCQKAVIDFSVMSDRQIAEFFKKPSSSVCGRFHQDQLERNIEPPKKRLPWLKYFFTIAIPTFLTAKKVAAQGEVVVKGKPAICVDSSKKNEAKPRTEDSKSRKISGQVFEESGKSIPYASIEVTGLDFKMVTLTDSNGKYSLGVPNKPSEVLITAVGYNSQRIKIGDQDIVNITLASRLYEATLGVVVVATKIKKTKKPPVQHKKVDSIAGSFSVFPNPISVGNSLNIQCKNFEPGSYIVAILNNFGQVIQQKEVQIDKQDHKASLTLQEMPPATYVVTLTNKKNGKPTSKIIVVE